MAMVLRVRTAARQLGIAWVALVDCPCRARRARLPGILQLDRIVVKDMSSMVKFCQRLLVTCNSFCQIVESGGWQR